MDVIKAYLAPSFSFQFFNPLQSSYLSTSLHLSTTLTLNLLHSASVLLGLHMRHSVISFTLHQRAYPFCNFLILRQKIHTASKYFAWHRSTTSNNSDRLKKKRHMLSKIPVPVVSQGQDPNHITVHHQDLKNKTCTHITQTPNSIVPSKQQQHVTTTIVNLGDRSLTFKAPKNIGGQKF